LTRPEALGSIYERIADLTPGQGSRREGPHDARKHRANYYTDEILAAGLVDRVLRIILDPGNAIGPCRPEPLSLAICDPSCGGGAFLIAAHRRLCALATVDRGPSPTSRLPASERSEFLCRCLHGVELDPDAVALARVALWLEAADPDLDPGRLRDNIRLGNSLIGAWRDAMSEDWPHGSDRAGRDLWCARWFDSTGSANPDRRTVAALRDEHSFFHWELEFAHVFARGGFDAVIGNPPWDTHRVDSRTFFARFDPSYRRRAKQDGLRRQEALFERQADLERAWSTQRESARAFARWCRPGAGPFRHQGPGDPSSYRLFAELAHRLLRPRGALGLIVPSGLYSDLGAAPLRRLFLRENTWDLLYGFENRRRVFDIDTRFKFCGVVVRKGGTTTELRTAFMREDPSELSDPHRYSVPLERRRIEILSPRHSTFVEGSGRDLEVLERLGANGCALGDTGPSSWNVAFRRELDMTLDSHRFRTRVEWERDGYRPDQYDRWLSFRRGAATPSGNPEDHVRLRDGRFVRVDDITGVALPVHEGRMVGQFDFSEKGWVEGHGRSARWRAIPFPRKTVDPRFLIGTDHLPDPSVAMVHKIGFVSVASATNCRSMVAAALALAPCGNSVPTLRSTDLPTELALLATLNSLVYDWTLRARLSGINLNRFVLDETPLPHPAHLLRIPGLAPLIAGLAWPHPRFARAWLTLPNALRQDLPLDAHFALGADERLRRRCILDAIVAHAYGLDVDDLAWILRDCGHPVSRLRDRRATARFDRKGFWRVDRDRPPGIRLAVLALAAFRDLTQSLGFDPDTALRGFVGHGDERGWQLPAELDLRELGLSAAPGGPIAIGVPHGPPARDDRPTIAGDAQAECRAHAALLARTACP
jgi:hypothetical protein